MKETSGGAASGGLMGLVVNVSASSTDIPLQLGANESFDLNIPDPSVSGTLVQINAVSVWGALRALETFSQVVLPGNPLTIACVPMAISDFPRFAHRGLMLDSARHFLPVSVILRQIDALAYSKMNTLHWHITDAEAFPIDSSSYPNLTAGAYTPSQVYSAADVKSVIAYATARGVRVVPEFDVPGHAYSWGAGYPITADCPRLNANINNVPLNPTKALTLQVVQGFINDMAALFTDDVIHLGGDEVIYSCWSDDPSIAQWMSNKGWSDYNKLMQYFVTAADGYATAAGKTITHWNDVFDSSITVPSTAIFQAWNGLSDVASIVQSGSQAIVSNSDKWYLNCGFNPGCAYQSWQNMYLNDPVYSIGTPLSPAEVKLVLGGEAVLFGEYADATDVDPQVWPRAAAIGERLWSDYASTQDTTTALPRLAYHRCRLVQRGVAAAPIGPGFCGPTV